METNLLNIANSLIPRLYNFAMVILSDDKKAQQLVLDAYTVYVMKEKRFLKKQLNTENSKKEMNSLKKFLRKELIKEIYDLGLKRLDHAHSKQVNYSKIEYREFFNLSLFKRSILFLKEKEGMSIDELQEVFVVQRYELIEAYYNSKNELLTVMPFEEIESNMETHYDH